MLRHKLGRAVTSWETTNTLRYSLIGHDRFRKRSKRTLVTYSRPRLGSLNGFDCPLSMYLG